MTKSTDLLKERLKNSCGWCGRYPPCSAALRGAAAAADPSAPSASAGARLEAGAAGSEACSTRAATGAGAASAAEQAAA